MLLYLVMRTRWVIWWNLIRFRSRIQISNLYVAYGWHSMFYHSTAQMSHYASIAKHKQVPTLYLLEVEVRVEDSREAEAVVASAPSRKNLSQHPKLCYNRGQKRSNVCILLKFWSQSFLGLLKELQNGCPFLSTGHLILVEEFVQYKDQNEAFMSMFNVVIQLGAILAVMVIYFNKAQSLQTW